MALIVIELSFVAPAIWPLHQPFAMHFALEPGSVVFTAIRPIVCTFSLNFIVVKFAHIIALIGKIKLPISMFLAILVVTFVC